jgi:hypothetical protein
MIILYIIFGLVVAMLISALFISKDLKATRSIIINKPKAEVFNYIRYLKNQQNYSKWATLDPDMKNEFRGTDGEVGFVNLWEGNKKVGQGEQEIKGIEEGKRLITELRFIKPFKSVAKATMSVEPVNENSTNVSWGFESQMNYPMNLMKLFMNMEKAIGDDFSIGLSNLKIILEK